MKHPLLPVIGGLLILAGMLFCQQAGWDSSYIIGVITLACYLLGLISRRVPLAVLLKLAAIAGPVAVYWYLVLLPAEPLTWLAIPLFFLCSGMGNLVCNLRTALFTLTTTLVLTGVLLFLWFPLVREYTALSLLLNS